MIAETIRFLVRYKFLLLKSAIPLSMILLLGMSFLLVGFNLQTAVQSYEGRFSLEIFFKNGTDEITIDSLKQFLVEQPSYDHLEFISQDAALERMTGMLGEDPSTVASLIFYPLDDYKNRSYLEILKQQVEQFAYVEQGVFAGEWLAELENFNQVFVRITLIFLVLVLIAYVLLFHMTINYLWLKYRPIAAKLDLLGMSRIRLRIAVYIWAAISAVLNSVLSLVILGIISDLISKHFIALLFFDPTYVLAIIIIITSISILLTIFKRMKIPKYE